jgi:hypothetical protein
MNYITHQDFAKLAGLLDESVIQPVVAMQQQVDNMQKQNDALFTHVEHLQSQLNKRQAQIEQLERDLAFIKVKDKLSEGVLPEMQHISLLEVQVFYTDFSALTEKELRKKRQAGHTEWSLKVEASIGGRKIRKGVDVGLFTGQQFARQVFASGFDPERIPEAIRAVATDLQDREDDQILVGMFKRLTSGNGTPYSRDHFAVLQGHLIEEPSVEIWSQGEQAVITSFRPAKGKGVWYLTGKPNLLALCT